jgi:hypothetical protein
VGYEERIRTGKHEAEVALEKGPERVIRGPQPQWQADRTGNMSLRRQIGPPDIADSAARPDRFGGKRHSVVAMNSCKQFELVRGGALRVKSRSGSGNGDCRNRSARSSHVDVAVAVEENLSETGYLQRD